MSRLGGRLGVIVSGIAVALGAAAQPDSASELDEALAGKVWRYVLPDVLEPLPPSSAQPAQQVNEAMRSGNLEVVVRAQRDFQRGRDPELRQLHASLGDDERAALRAYVDAGNLELPQLRRMALTQAICGGRARSGADLAAAYLGAEMLYAEHMLGLVQGLTAVLDTDSYRKILARAAGQGDRIFGLDLVRLIPADGVHYAEMPREQAIAEINRICRGVWSFHSDGLLA